MNKRNIVHIEIPAKDVAAAGRFYEGLFGWKITSDPVMNYTMWEPGEMPGGGFNPLSDAVKPGDVIIYVSSDDIDADLQHVEALGGEVLYPKTEIPNIGFFGTFKDPSGNTIALYTSMRVN